MTSHFVISLLITVASSVYQVKNIEGKGLGCVASMNIKRGSTILREIPQIPFIQGIWFKVLLFEGM